MRFLIVGSGYTSIPMHETLAATLGLGFLLGLKHAAEADHLAAVSTMVSERRSLWQSALVGALWGLGHTSTLLVAGFCVLGLGLAIPQRIADVLELAVAVMIVILGMRLLHLHFHSHAHGGRPHIHLHFDNEQHPGTHHSGLLGWRPVVVGMVHGLAGSAALTLLVLSEVVRSSGTGAGFAYIVVFGIGSIGGMLLMSGLIGLPFSFGMRFFRRTVLPLRLTTALLSTAFGLLYALRTIQKLAVF